MKDKRYSRFTVLCEGSQDEIFARYFIRKYFNYPDKPIDVHKRLPGQGSGEQFVREQLIPQLNLYRRKKNSLQIALIVIIDADVQEASSRMDQINQTLKAENIAPIEKDEQAAIFVPRRNIETWIYALNNPQEIIDETCRYPKLEKGKEKDCTPLVEQLAENCRNHIELPANAPNSLRQACQELARIPRD